MQDWKFPGPDKLHLNREEVCAACGFGEAHLRKLVSDGRFPRPLVSGQGKTAEQRWLGSDVAAWLYMAGRCRPDEEEEEDNSQGGAGK